jgi:hypothetical protein
MVDRVIELAGRGLRGALGIIFNTVPTPGQFIAKAAGDNPSTFVTLQGATPANAVALTDLASEDGSSLTGHRNKNVSEYLSVMYPDFSICRAYGDSITVGYVGNAVDVNRSWVKLLGDEIGKTFINRGISGGSIPDWLLNLYADPTQPKQLSTILPGFNDGRFIGESPVFLSGYRTMLAAAVAWASVSDADKIKASDSRIQYFSNWSATGVGPYTFGRFSQTEGAAAALPPIYGDTINLCFLLQNNFGGVVAIEVDGIVRTTVNLIGNGVSGTAIGNGGAIKDGSGNPTLFAPRMITVANCGPGKHDVVIRKMDATSTDGGRAVHFLWADSGLRESEDQPVVLLGDTLTMNAAGASGLAGYNNYTRAGNASISLIARQVAAEAALSGYNVQFVAASQAWSAVNDPSNDNVHPPISGHLNIMKMFARELRGVKNYGSATASIEEPGQTAASFADLTFANGWQNFGADYTAGQYLKDANGFVHLRGLLKGGAVTPNGLIATLPVGFRPALPEYFSALAFDGVVGGFRVMANGEIQFVSGNNTWFSLSGCSFKAG